jgi:hypothetical protein
MEAHARHLDIGAHLSPAERDLALRLEPEVLMLMEPDALADRDRGGVDGKASGMGDPRPPEGDSAPDRGAPEPDASLGVKPSTLHWRKERSPFDARSVACERRPVRAHEQKTVAIEIAGDMRPTEIDLALELARIFLGRVHDHASRHRDPRGVHRALFGTDDPGAADLEVSTDRHPAQPDLTLALKSPACDAAHQDAAADPGAVSVDGLSAGADKARPFEIQVSRKRHPAHEDASSSVGAHK